MLVTSKAKLTGPTLDLKKLKSINEETDENVALNQQSLANGQVKLKESMIPSHYLKPNIIAQSLDNTSVNLEEKETTENVISFEDQHLETT